MVLILTGRLVNCLQNGSKTRVLYDNYKAGGTNERFYHKAVTIQDSLGKVSFYKFIYQYGESQQACA